MIFKKITSNTGGAQRNLVQLKKLKILIKTPFLKTKLIRKKQNSGRNNQGKITVAHKGNGHKRRYRTIDFLRTQASMDLILSIEYDPYRTAFISALYNIKKKTFKYILTPKSLVPGNIVKSGPLNYDCKVGNAAPLKNIPVGSVIHNIATKPNSKGKLTRSAGTFSRLIKKELNKATVSLSSGRFQTFPISCFATLGTVSNNFKFLGTCGKAGRARWLNKRPTTRGVAMNPVDHPNGGGEGKASGRKLTPWGKR